MWSALSDALAQTISPATLEALADSPEQAEILKEQFAAAQAQQDFLAGNQP